MRSRTAAVSSNPWISSGFGFDQGFEAFEYRPRKPAAEIVRAGIDLLERLSRGGEPFFLYLHFLDPHDPYAPPEPYAEMFPGDLRRAGFSYPEAMQRPLRHYDGEIRYLDDELGRLFSFLKQKGIYDRAMIVVIADHGEQFLEHGRTEHGNALHNEEIHVPFFVRDPPSGRGAEVVDAVVSTVDLFPSILGQLEILPAADQRDGISLFDTGALDRRAGVVAEIHRITDQRAFISKDQRKAIFDIPLLPEEEDEDAQRAALWERPGLEGLYDIQTDYFEQRPLDDPHRLARMRSQMVAAFKRASTRSRNGANAPQGEISDELEEQLRSLGYLK
jgi:arylsulfatase A-like enzyme